MNFQLARTAILVLALPALMLAGGAKRRSHAVALKHIQSAVSGELTIANHVHYGSSIADVMSRVPKEAWLGHAAKGISRLRRHAYSLYLRWGRHTFRAYFIDGRLVYGNESFFTQSMRNTAWNGADVCVPGTTPPPGSPEFSPTVYWVNGDQFDAFGKPYGNDFAEANRL